MAETIRISLQVPASFAADLDRLESDMGIRSSEVVRKAVGLLQLYREARAAGHSVGSVTDPSNLDREFVVI